MKILLKLFVIVVFLQGSKCAKGVDKTNVSAETLVVQKQKIVEYIKSFPCNPSVGCNSIAFGSKPCGGPWEYLVFSNAVNLSQLQTMVAEYNQAEATFNLETGAASDCMVVSPPTNIGCENGKCKILN